MLNRQKKEIVSRIANAGISREQIQIREVESQVTVKFAGDSQLWFAFQDQSDREQFKVRWTDYKRSGSITTSGNVVSFDVGLKHFEKWLEKELVLAVDDQAIPDPFQQPFTSPRNSTLDDISSDDESNFSEQEVKSLKASVGELQASVIAQMNLTTELKAMVLKELKYLQDSAERLNKRDFKTVAYKILYDLGMGITANLILSEATVATDALHPLYLELVQRAFSSPLPLLGH